MNEDETRVLLKDSLLHTSAFFTDELMQKLEKQLHFYRVFKRWLMISCVACWLLMIGVWFIKLPPVIEIYQFHLTTPPLPVRVAVIISVLIVLNRMITLRRQLKMLFFS